MIEIRYLNPNSFVNNDSIIAIGSEHCSLEFIYEVNKALPYIKNKLFRLVTPKVDQFHFQDVINAIDLVLEINRPESVIVNDLGVLYYLKKYALNITLGRVLVSTYAYRDTLDDFIHPKEKTSIVVNALAPNIIHKSKIKLFQKYGATALELCPLPNEEKYVTLLRHYGMKIHIHCNSYIAALSKVCYTLNAEDDIFCCNHYCTMPQKLGLSYMSHYNPTSRNSLTESEFTKMQRSFPHYMLSGNTVYRIDNDKTINENMYDTIIIDKRFPKEVD